MKLNCDLGEGLDDIDALLMPHIDMASIACGGHAGDNSSMEASIERALRYNTIIGAHPSYPDRDNFGRVSLVIDYSHLANSLAKQVESLIATTEQLNAEVRYIKPHGALYNDALTKPEILKLLTQLAINFQLPLVVQTHPYMTMHCETPIILEAFADRAYTNDGQLVARRFDHALLTQEQAIAQTRQLCEQQGVFSDSGKWLDIKADTICIHSDTPNAINTVIAIKKILSSHQP